VGAARHGWYPLAARPYALALLLDPGIGFQQLVVPDPAAAPAAAPAEGQQEGPQQQAAGGAEAAGAGGCDVEMAPEAEAAAEGRQQQEGSAAGAGAAAAGGAAAAPAAAAAPVLAVPPGSRVTTLPDKKWHTFVGDVAKRLKALRRALADPHYLAPPPHAFGGAQPRPLLLPRRCRAAPCLLLLLLGAGAAAAARPSAPDASQPAPLTEPVQARAGAQSSHTQRSHTYTPHPTC
jgi:hypothetical protein